MSNPPEDELLFHIGWMADSFSRLETAVVDCFASIVNSGNPRIGEIICDQLSLRQTLGLVNALLKESLNAKATKEFGALTKQIEKASKIRNDILHSTWVLGDGLPNDIIQERARRRHPGPSGHKLDKLIEDIDEGVNLIQDSEMKVNEFHRTHLKDPSPKVK